MIPFRLNHRERVFCLFIGMHTGQKIWINPTVLPTLHIIVVRRYQTVPPLYGLTAVLNSVQHLSHIGYNACNKFSQKERIWKSSSFISLNFLSSCETKKETSSAIFQFRVTSSLKILKQILPSASFCLNVSSEI